MPSIGTLLVNARVISQKQFDEALQCQVLFGGSIGTNLMELGYVREETLAAFLAKQLQVETPSAGQLDDIPGPVISLLPAPLAQELYAVPFEKKGDRLRVAMADPRDHKALRILEAAVGAPIEPHVVVEARLAYLLEQYYDVKGEPRYVNLIRNLANQHSSEDAVKTPPEETASRVHIAQSDAGATGHFDRLGSHRPVTRKVTRISREELDGMLATADSRDDVAQVVLAYAQSYLRRGCLLVVKRETAYGWAGYGPNIDPGSVRGIMVPLSQPSVFRTVRETRAPYLGPMGESPVNRRFLAAFGGQEPKTVIAVPIAYGKNLIALLYGDNGMGKGVPPKHVSELQILSDRVANTFSQIIERLRQRVVS